MMMMVAVATPHRLCQILDVGKLAALRGIGEVRRQLVELIRRVRIPFLLGGLGGALQVGGNLLRDLLVLGWVRLLKLLERAQQLGERRKLAVVWRLPDRRRAGAGQTLPGGVGRRTGTLESCVQERL